MNELTDLEICKRIARIEGYKSTQCGNVECAENHYIVIGNGEYKELSEPYNPIEDKLLCFDLEDKYDVRYIDGVAYHRPFVNRGDFLYNRIAVEGPSRAHSVLLCIIEANNNES